MPKSYQLLIFDLDGTLIDSRADIAAATNRTLHTLGYAGLSDQEVARFVGSGVSHLLTHALQATGAIVSDQLLAQALASFKVDYGRNCLIRTNWYPGVVQTLTQLPQRIFKAIFTNKPTQFTDTILAGLRGREFFQDIYCGDASVPKKPDPQALYELMAKYSLGPEDVLLIGDSFFDAQTAVNGGIDFAFVEYGFQTHADLRGLPVRYRWQGMESLLTLFQLD